jgi:hypothetical protein
MIFGAENSIQLARFRDVALAEVTLLCKAKQRRRGSSANPEADVADGLAAKVLFQRSHDLGFRDVRAPSARRSEETDIRVPSR